MKIMIKVVVVCTLSSAFSFSFEPVHKVITLISKDGHQSVTVPGSIVRTSPEIRKVIESGTTSVQTAIPPKLLEYLSIALNSFKKNQNLSEKQLYDAVYADLARRTAPTIPSNVKERLSKTFNFPINNDLVKLQSTLPIGTIIGLFNVAQDYHLEQLYDLMGRELMNYLLVEPKLVPWVRTKLHQGPWLKKLNSWHLKMTGKELPHMKYSVQELLDKGNLLPEKIFIKTNRFGKTYYNFEMPYYNINSLQGLDTIPGIKEATTITLSANALENISHGFANFPHLIELHLAGNRIKNWTPGTFPDSLELLDLNHNQIEILDTPGIFPANLDELYLGQNKIRHIDPRILPIKLRFLDLTGNPISAQEIARLRSERPDINITTERNERPWPQRRAGAAAPSVRPQVPVVPLDPMVREQLLRNERRFQQMMESEGLRQREVSARAPSVESEQALQEAAINRWRNLLSQVGIETEGADIEALDSLIQRLESTGHTPQNTDPEQLRTFLAEVRRQTAWFGLLVEAGVRPETSHDTLNLMINNLERRGLAPETATAQQIQDIVFARQTSARAEQPQVPPAAAFPAEAGRRTIQHGGYHWELHRVPEEYHRVPVQREVPAEPAQAYPGRSFRAGVEPLGLPERQRLEQPPAGIAAHPAEAGQAQRAVLEELSPVDAAFNRWRNLILQATGTDIVGLIRGGVINGEQLIEIIDRLEREGHTPQNTTVQQFRNLIRVGRQ